jgi:peptidyl-prolyl cis-trans isomerase C
MTDSNLPARFAASRVALALLAVLSLGLAGFFTTVGVTAYVTALPADAALRAADRVVTVDELEARGRTMRALYGVEAPRSDSPDYDLFRRELAASMAIGIVIEVASLDRGLAATEDEGRDLLAGFVRERFPEGRNAFVAALAETGASESAMLDEVRLQSDTARLFEDVTRDVQPVTDEEVRQSYEEGKDELVVPEQRQLRNIVVANEASAQTLRQEIDAGADFATLARERSLDGSSRDAGGGIGLLPRGVLEAPYADAAFAAAPGGVFGPVQTRSGWNVGQVVEAVPLRPLSFEEVSADLQARLDQDRAMEVWQGFVDGQLREADVTYARDFTPVDPAETQSTQSAPSVEPRSEPAAPTPATPDTAAPAGAPSAIGAVAFAIVQLVFAVALILVGLWAWRNAGQLAPAALPADERARKARVYGRGALACLVVGVVFVVAAVLSFGAV